MFALDGCKIEHRDQTPSKGSSSVSLLLIGILLSDTNKATYLIDNEMESLHPMSDLSKNHHLYRTLAIISFRHKRMSGSGWQILDTNCENTESQIYGGSLSLRVLRVPFALFLSSALKCR